MKEKLSDLIDRVKVDVEDEWLIISNMIMSESVISYASKKYIAGQLKSKHFGSYFQIIFRWLIQYYTEFEKAPKSTIQEVFKFYKKSLNEDTAKIIEEYLDRLATEYQEKLENNIDSVNPDFIINKIIPRFQKKQEAELVLKQIQDNLNQNNVDNFKQVIDSFTEISDEDEEDSDIGTVIPGALRSVKRHFSDDVDLGVLFKPPGALGQLIGNLSKQKTVAVMGVEKSGKTYFMQELARYAMNFHKMKVLDINLEMPIEEKEERFWQSETRLAIDEDHSGKLIYPIFDCENNQYGTCEVRKRQLNKQPLLLYPEDIAAFDENKNWVPCVKCRYIQQRTNAKKTKRYVPAIWFKQKNFKHMTERRVLSCITNRLPYGLSNYRIKCFPRFSATFDDIKDYIIRYIKKKNWKPNIIIWDYPDICRPVEGVIMDRFNIDHNWKSIAGLTQELDCLTLVADQAVKAARNKRSLDTMDTSESKTKDAHIDLRISLNRTDIEYELGLQRVGMLFRRKGRKHLAEVMLTQRLETGSIILDSEWWFKNNITYQVCRTKKDVY